MMKSLLNGCAAVALLVGLASQAHAQVEVREALVHSVPAAEDTAATPSAQAAAAPVMAMAPPASSPADDADRLDAAPAAKVELTRSEPAKGERTVVKALMTPKAEPVPSLSPEETAFLSVLGKRVTDAASAYESYVRRAVAIDARFSDAAAVQRAVKIGDAYQPQQLQEGIVAYAALLALRNDDFVDAVKSMRDPSFADRLASSPQAVLGLRGAAQTAAEVASTLRAQGAALTAAGKSITQAAYDVQEQSWSKTPVSDPKGVLNGAKEAASAPRAASISAKTRLLESLVAPPASAAPIPVSNSAGAAPDVVRGLALAALAIMGKTGDDKEANFEALLRDATSTDCLKMAKMNLNQCLAVAGPQYEDVHCTGRHAVGETAKCVSGAANTAGGAVMPPPSLPMQRADDYGPEQARAYGRPGLNPVDRDDDDTPTPAPQRYANAAPAYSEPSQAYAPPRAPAPAPAYQDARQAYAQNDAAPYQDPRGYAPAYQAQAYAPPPQPYPQAYSAQPYASPYEQSQYPYAYAGRGYYGQ